MTLKLGLKKCGRNSIEGKGKGLFFEERLIKGRKSAEEESWTDKLREPKVFRKSDWKEDLPSFRGDLISGVLSYPTLSYPRLD